MIWKRFDSNNKKNENTGFESFYATLVTVAKF